MVLRMRVVIKVIDRAVEKGDQVVGGVESYIVVMTGTEWR